MSVPTSIEIELLKASIRGDTVAFEAIVKKYQSFVCAITYSCTGDINISEELAQEAFVTVWKNLGQLKDLYKFPGWLNSITRNIIRHFIASRRRDLLHQATPIGTAEEVAARTYDPRETAITKEQHAVVRQALQHLPEQYREPLVLFYRQDRSVKNVAEQLGLSEEAVKQRLSRGRKLLKGQVMAMVESTISRTGPGKAFTTAVIASIMGMAIKVSSASAAGIGATTSATSANVGSATIMSGMSAKIIAAVVIAGIVTSAVVIYKQAAKLDRGPDSSGPKQILQEQREEQYEPAGDAVRQAQSDAAGLSEADETNLNLKRTMPPKGINPEFIGRVESEEPVYIPDANLKAAIERTLGTSEPNQTEMLNLISLRAEGAGIVDLTGLECATNLSSLYLKDNEIGDISPLKRLVNLGALNICGNQISDISALSGLKKMVSLSAADNLIKDISVLHGLGQLNDADLSGNGIRELPELSTNLTSLSVKDNQIGDISPLKKLVNLQNLNICGNQVSDISALSGLKKMVSLRAADNLITDISVLYGLHMNDADLSGNRIRELPERSITSEALLLYNNEIEDIRGIHKSHILDHRPEIILWEGNRDPNITPPALYVRDKDDNPVDLPKTVRDKIYEVTLDYFYQNNFFEMLKPRKFSDLFGGVFCCSIPGDKELTLYSYYMRSQRSITSSLSHSVLIVYDPNTDMVTSDPAIYPHGNLNMDKNIPKSLVLSFFEDINLDGNSEIIGMRGEHYGTQANSIYHTYYHIGTDLSLIPVICLEAWQSTARSVPYAERGTYYNVVRYIEPIQPNLIIVHTTLSLDPYEIGDEEAGYVVLQSQNASSAFELISRTVLMEGYSSDSFLDGECRW